MKKTDTVNFYYFSGTGNTLLATKKIAEVLQSFGITVNLRRIEKTERIDLDKNSILGLAFPVAVQSTYPFIWEFLNDLPEANGTDVFMVDTLGGKSGGIIGPLQKLLTKKGYRTIGAKEVIMPSNLANKITDQENEKIREKGLKVAETYATDLFEGKTTWGKSSFLQDMVRQISKIDFIWKLFGKWIVIDNEKCVKCGLCAKLCPVSNIISDGNDFPVKNKNCEACMRCISFCPQEAIMFRGKKVKKYRAVKSSELLKDL